MIRRKCPGPKDRRVLGRAKARTRGRAYNCSSGPVGDAMALAKKPAPKAPEFRRFGLGPSVAAVLPVEEMGV